jgi:hypothetical protein
MPNLIHIICLYPNWLIQFCSFVIFQFVYTHIASFVTHTHSEVVANEVMAEGPQLVHVHPDPLVLENSTNCTKPQ